MAIKTENITINDKVYERTYSDEDLRIRQIETGIIYDDAVDVIPNKYTYEETNEPIPEPAEEDDKSDTEES